jgi:hypothetical protein
MHNRTQRAPAFTARSNKKATPTSRWRKRRVQEEDNEEEDENNI